MFVELRNEKVTSKVGDKKRTLLGLRDEMQRIIMALNKNEKTLHRERAKLDFYNRLANKSSDITPKFLDDLQEKTEKMAKYVEELELLRTRIDTETKSLTKLESIMNSVIRSSSNYESLENNLKQLDQLMTHYNRPNDFSNIREQSLQLGEKVTRDNAAQVFTLCRTIIPLVAKLDQLQSDLDKTRLLNRIMEELLRTEPANEEKHIFSNYLQPELEKFDESQEIIAQFSIDSRLQRDKSLQNAIIRYHDIMLEKSIYDRGMNA